MSSSAPTGHSPGTSEKPLDEAQRLLNEDLAFIENSARSIHSKAMLRWLDDRGTAESLVEAEYGGRYVFELLQKANDAAGSKEAPSTDHKVVFMITERSLLVANEGQGFRDENVRSICRLGQSSKDPRKTIGYKGLGFKAVGEVTDRPQVISPPNQFELNRERARREVMRRVGELPDQIRFRLPKYAFPFPLTPGRLGEDRNQVTRLLDEGFVTVIRLPFRGGLDWHGVAEQVRSAISPQLLLFLDATTEIEIIDPGQTWRVRRRTVGRRGRGTIVSLEQGDNALPTWLVYRSAPIRVQEQDLVRRLDRSWHRVTQVSATLAFPLDDDGLALDQPAKPINVYFPTEASSGHSFLINSDFCLDLDRWHISETPEARPYNEWLAGKVASFFAREVLLDLTRVYPGDCRVAHACAPAANTNSA